MLTELKNELLILASESDRAFRREIASRWPRRGVGKAAENLRSLILVLPEMIAQIRSWIEALPEGAKRLKPLHGHMMTYLHHPADLIPEHRGHLFGYLDDAYCVGRVYEALAPWASASGQRFLPNTHSLSKRLPGWLETARAVIPQESHKIDVMIERLQAGEPQALAEALG